MKKGNYGESCEKYKKALELSNEGPNSHIYYCNLACALGLLGKYEESIEACLNSISLKEDYAKAYSRLGYAYSKIKKLEEAKENYEKALKYDSTLENAKKSLESINNKLLKKEEKEEMEEIDTDSKNNIPNMNGLEQMMGGLGGLGGLGEMMQNPEMMKMAQGMMQNPEMMKMAQGMMQNPDMMNNMMSNMGN